MSFKNECSLAMGLVTKRGLKRSLVELSFCTCMTNKACISPGLLYISSWAWVVFVFVCFDLR